MRCEQCAKAQAVAFDKIQATTSRGYRQYEYVPKNAIVFLNIVKFQNLVHAIPGSIPMHFFLKKSQNFKNHP